MNVRNIAHRRLWALVTMSVNYAPRSRVRYCNNRQTHAGQMKVGMAGYSPTCNNQPLFTEIVARFQTNEQEHVRLIANAEHQCRQEL